MHKQIQNETVQLYLQYVEDTESPRLFHIWSLLSAAGAALGRHAYVDTGIGREYANEFVWLVGPPGTRKSSAINTMHKLVRDYTDVRLAPEDTAGHRQGLIYAIENYDEDERDEIDIDDPIHMASIDPAFDLATLKTSIDDFGADAHHMYVVASELHAFLGRNAFDMISFLGKLFDGEDYRYKLKNEEITLREPLLNMLAATTPTQIYAALPQEAIGQGFMSRIILVHGHEKYKKIPRPRPKDEGLRERVGQVLSHINHRMQGPVFESSDAMDAVDALYDYNMNIQDSRFSYYSERRHMHLRKVCMQLAALRKSMEISVQDVEDAQLILSYTEQTMPDALGQYGMNKLATAKQQLLEFLRSVRKPMEYHTLFAAVQQHVTQVECQTCLHDLVNAGNLHKAIVKRDGVDIAMYSFNDPKLRSAAQLLLEDDVQ